MTDKLTERVKYALTPEQINELVGEMESLADFAPVPSGGLRAVLARALTAIRQLQEAQKDAERLYAVEREVMHIIYGESMKYGSGWYAYPQATKIKDHYAHISLRAAIDAAIQTKEQGS